MTAEKTEKIQKTHAKAAHGDGESHKKTHKGKADYYKYAVLVLVVLLAISLFTDGFRNFNRLQREAPEGTQQEGPQEPQGEAPALADTSKDPKISLIVLNDKSCTDLCDPSQIIDVTKQKLFPTAEVREVDISSAEGKDLLDTLDIAAVPAFIFDENVEKGANYVNIKEALIKKGDKYVINPVATGVGQGFGKILNPPSADDDPVKGKADAPVTIIEFSDFQCPFCAKFYKETLPSIDSQYIKTGKVKLVFRDFPLSSIHQTAQKAAEAGECAHEQGKFWEMHNKIFDNQESLSVDNLKKWAADLGLDTTKFNSCLDSGKYESEVEDDVEDAQAAFVSGTPSFFVNGVAVSGALPYDSFKQIIDSQLNAASK